MSYKLLKPVVSLRLQRGDPGYLLARADSFIKKNDFVLQELIDECRTAMILVDNVYYDEMLFKRIKGGDLVHFSNSLGVSRIDVETMRLLMDDATLSNESTFRKFLENHFSPRTEPRFDTVQKLMGVLDRTVVFDVEFTNVYDMENCHIMELCAALFHFPMHGFGPVSVKMDAGQAMMSSDWVKKNQGDKLRASLKNAVFTDCQIDDMLSGWLSGKDGLVLAGNNIHTDWAVMKRRLPKTCKMFIAKLDISTLKLLWDNLKGERTPLPSKSGLHSCGLDVIESIRELQHYLMFAL